MSLGGGGGGGGGSNQRTPYISIMWVYKRF